MAREGELFVSLEPTIEESSRSGGRYQYQQVVVESLIQEFGTEVRVLCQTPPCARFQLNNNNIPFPIIPLGLINQPAKPGEIRPLGQCMHLGYVSEFFVIRGVPECSIARRDYPLLGNLIPELSTASSPRSGARLMRTSRQGDISCTGIIKRGWGRECRHNGPPRGWNTVKKAKVGKSDERIFLHIPYHPQNPSSGFVQNIWRNIVLLPPGKENLNQLTNWEGQHVPIKRLTVAFHRNPNLANLNSYRKLSLRTGLKPSTFIT